jgi:hypothetical protein
LLDEVNRKSVNQFVGEEATDENLGSVPKALRVQEFHLPFVQKKRKEGPLLFYRGGTDLRQDIIQISIEIPKLGTTIMEDIRTEKTPPSAHLHKGKWGRMTEDFPHLVDLAGKELSKDRMDVGAGIIVTRRPGLFPEGAIITFAWMVKNQVHKLSKGDSATGPDAVPEDPYQFLIFRPFHVWYYNPLPWKQVSSFRFQVVG